MQGQTNKTVVGATLIGVALVAGAYLISNHKRPVINQTANVQQAVTTPRVSVAVTDNNNNGIEDWRDEFIDTKPITITSSSSSASTYVPPDTLTGKTGIEFMQNIVLAKSYGPFGSSQDKIIENTVDYLAKSTEVDLYDTPDISIMEKWDDRDIVNYANTLAAILKNNSKPDLDAEINILKDILDSGDDSRLGELKELAAVYKSYRVDTLKLPVPKFLAKEHLDIINTYNAIYNDITAMIKAYDDPAVTLLRLKRYQDDVDGMYYALQNMFLALEPYAGLFTVDDPAVLLVAFSPDFRM